MKPSDRQRTAIVAALPPVIGDEVGHGTAEVAPYPVPGLPEDAVWRVSVTHLDHPQQTYVGIGPDGRGHVLPDDQPAFFALVTALGGARLPDPETALGYVLAFLEVTRGPSVLVRPVTDVAEIRWRPGSADEEERRAAFLADPRLRRPTTEPSGDGYRVELLLIVDQRVQLNTFDVSPAGAIDAGFRVIATDLPLPIAR